DRRGINMEVLREYLREGDLIFFQRHNRLDVDLTVWVEVLLAVEVDSQIRNAHQRTGIDQPPGAIFQDRLAGEFELPVEPGVQDWSAIDLYCQLRPSNVVKIGVGLDHKARGVGMRTDDFE